MWVNRFDKDVKIVCILKFYDVFKDGKYKSVRIKCQKLLQQYNIHTLFQVLKGGDGAIGFAVRKPDGKVVHPYQWKASSEYEENTAAGGYYSVCLDNQFSKFAAKLVNLYLTTFRYDEWEKFAQELQVILIS